MNHSRVLADVAFSEQHSANGVDNTPHQVRNNMTKEVNNRLERTRASILITRSAASGYLLSQSCFSLPSVVSAAPNGEDGEWVLEFLLLGFSGLEVLDLLPSTSLLDSSVMGVFRLYASANCLWVSMEMSIWLCAR